MDREQIAGLWSLMTGPSHLIHAYNRAIFQNVDTISQRVDTIGRKHASPTSKGDRRSPQTRYRLFRFRSCAYSRRLGAHFPFPFFQTPDKLRPTAVDLGRDTNSSRSASYPSFTFMSTDIPPKSPGSDTIPMSLWDGTVPLDRYLVGFHMPLFRTAGLIMAFLYLSPLAHSSFTELPLSSTIFRHFGIVPVIGPPSHLRLGSIWTTFG
ncbi:hypothetical protein F4778DRAFT_78738 [Xylariomycetidae sp. FL2044]|nr:hypothetical protein F4778DRAFT_78738 [Xylariomycetidae sp. FL2044]